MRNTIARCAAALLALLILAALLPATLAEPVDDDWIAVEEEPLPVEEASLPEEEAPGDGIVADGEADFDAATVVAELDLAGDNPNPEAGDGADSLDLPEGEDGANAAVLATPEAGVGYYAVAAGTEVYTDEALTLCSGSFPEGATVYAEAVVGDGAVLRIRFDTEAARGWALELPSGYVQAEYTLAFEEADTSALLKSLKANAGTRSADGVPVPCVAFSPAEYTSLAEEEATGLGVAAPTQAQIQAFVDDHPAYAGQVNIYSIAATDEPYAVGSLSPVNQRSALNLLNQIRYIAGLDANLTLLSDMELMEASAALVLRLNGALSHYPERPEALADGRYDDLYQLGYAGAGRSNIAKGYKVTGSILAYMADADDSNIATVGHRRWILNPRMGKTVMGANGSYSAMYAHDMSGTGGQTKVAWPAQQMPMQYFSVGDPWSISFGRALEADGVEVDLVRQSDGRAWHFSLASSDGPFYVENRSYGQKGCVIFRPDGLEGIAEGDAFNVTVSDGATGEITRYTVHFFRLDLSAATPLDRPEVAAEKTDGGNALSWNAVSRATGYYVCRRTADTLYGIIADVTGGTAFLDTTASPDETYAYQVYAHNDSVTCALTNGVIPAAPEPTKVALNKSGKVRLYTNDTLQLEASLAPALAESGLTWKSGNKKVAKVDKNGLVKPVKTGTTVISVKTDNGLTASVKVKVVKPPKPKKVKLDKSGTVRLNLGEKLRLNATLSPRKAASRLTWSSSNKKVAKVSSKGKVTALKAGKATITVRTCNGKKAKVRIRVVDPYAPTGVSLDQTGTVKLRVGETLRLKATLEPENAVSKLKWCSSRKRVAKVSSKGLVKALKAGTTTITVRTANGKTAKVKIKVVN